MPHPLSNVIRVDYEGVSGSRSIIFNQSRIEESEAIRMVNAGEYCPYVLDIPTEQFEGLFLNHNANWVPPEWMKTGQAPAQPKEATGAARFVKGGPEPQATIRNQIHSGLLVDIVLKKDQPTGRLTRGRVKDILTNSPQHHRGIKVRLTDGQVGRIQAIIREGEGKPN